MNPRILLISIMLNPQYSNGGVDHVAGFLRWKGLSVDIAYFHNNNSLEDIRNNISYDYDYYGFSVDIKNVDRCIALANYIKEKTDAKIWFGGLYVSCCYKNLFEDCFGVDYIILGGGEEPLWYLFNNENDLQPIEHPSIATRDSLENKCFHDTTQFDYPIAEDYYITHPAAKGFYTYCLQTKNNTCGGRCSFCINWTMERNRLEFTYREVDDIVNEIKLMYQKYQITHFFFIDDDILDPGTKEAKARIADFCRKVIDLNLGITMTGYTKANIISPCKEDDELLDLMYQAGFVSLFVGIESGSQKDLTLFRKMANVENNRQVLPLLYKHRIKPEYEMITFHPYTTLETLKENFLFLHDVESYNYRHYTISGVSIYQNTALYRDVLRDGLLAEGYSYKEPDYYLYKHEDVAYMAEFIKKYFQKNREIGGLVTADQLVTYFYRFSRYSERVSEMEDKINKVRHDNFWMLQDYFAPLYLKNDYDYCVKNYEAFVKEYKNQADIIQKLVNKMLKFSILEKR